MSSKPSTVAAPTLPALFHTAPGRLLMVAAFTVLLAITGAIAWPAVAAILVLTSIFPQHRRVFLTLATIAVIVVSPPLDLDTLAEIGDAREAQAWLLAWPLVVVAILAGACGFVHAVQRSPQSLVGRRPVLILLAALTALLVASAHAPLRGGPWFLVTSSAMILGSYVWFFAYAASESKLRGARLATEQLGYWRPFWGFSNVPLGKGSAYLERVEAKNNEQLARSQWRGLALMTWAAVVIFAMDLFGRSVYAPFGRDQGIAALVLGWIPAEGLPRIAQVLERQVQGNPYPFELRWASVVAEFVLSVLHMMAWGHPIMATCRMAGFDAASNTDRPLLSTSVAEFYNRFYFYFKELLATFFFYPTYFRYFRAWPQLRLFTATLAAAGAGNFLFHFYRDSHQIVSLGMWKALVAYQVYGVYALLLGVAVGVSQIRLSARGRRKPTGFRRVVATGAVIVFYGLLNVLDAPSPYPIGQYAALYLSLLQPGSGVLP